MSNHPKQFDLLSRILRWLMGAMLQAMLFIGVSLVASLGNYHRLVAIHTPLGIMILIGSHPAGRPDVHYAADISANHVSPGTIRCHGI